MSADQKTAEALYQAASFNGDWESAATALRERVASLEARLIDRDEQYVMAKGLNVLLRDRAEKAEAKLRYADGMLARLREVMNGGPLLEPPPSEAQAAGIYSEHHKAGCARFSGLGPSGDVCTCGGAPTK